MIDIYLIYQVIVNFMPTPIISKELQFFIHFAKAHAVMSRRFDARLSGLGFSVFLILFALNETKDEKLRRTDLANHLGLTASGVTRMLIPMEKIGLIKRETNAMDGRVSYVLLTSAGKRMLIEALENAEDVSKSAVRSEKIKNLHEFSTLLSDIAKTS